MNQFGTIARTAAPLLATLAIAFSTTGCGSSDPATAPAAPSTTEPIERATPTSSISVDSPVGRFVTRLSANDGRADLAGVWGFNIESDGTWSLCPFCTTVPGPFGGTYTIDGDQITLGADSTCASDATYTWSTAEGSLALTAVGDDPCGLVPGNRQFVLTRHPLSST